MSEMSQEDSKSQFRAKPLRPVEPGGSADWAFVVLPLKVSSKLSRRGRTTVQVLMNGYRFEGQLEPDGQKSHWLRINESELELAEAVIGEEAAFQISALEQEPEPEVPADLAVALEVSPESRATWDATTTIARIDWVHWVTSAKQAKTRSKRIKDACEMLASGKKRVCCFDPSGFYSKAFSAPTAEEATS